MGKRYSSRKRYISEALGVEREGVTSWEQEGSNFLNIGALGREGDFFDLLLTYFRTTQG